MTDTAITVHIRHIANETELWCQYDGQFEPQPTYLNLDLEDGELFCDYNPNIGGGVTAAEFHNRILGVRIPTLTGSAANALMAEVAPFAQRVLAGASIEWDGNNHVGTLTDDAQAAWDELTSAVEEGAFGADTVDGLDAADWYTNGDDDQLCEELGLTADTADEELDAMVETAEAGIKANAMGAVVVQGVGGYLTRLRDEQRNAAREKLEEAAEQFTTARETRDRLIRQIAAWGVDSDRAIAGLADLSHTAVQKIVKASE